ISFSFLHIISLFPFFSVSRHFHSISLHLYPIASSPPPSGAPTSSRRRSLESRPPCARLLGAPLALARRIATAGGEDKVKQRLRNPSAAAARWTKARAVDTSEVSGGVDSPSGERWIPRAAGGNGWDAEGCIEQGNRSRRTMADLDGSTGIEELDPVEPLWWHARAPASAPRQILPKQVSAVGEL
ncbi:unnamed protein product, partial [Urochloa humidicola]